MNVSNPVINWNAHDFSNLENYTKTTYYFPTNGDYDNGDLEYKDAIQLKLPTGMMILISNREWEAYVNACEDIGIFINKYKRENKPKFDWSMYIIDEEGNRNIVKVEDEETHKEMSEKYGWDYEIDSTIPESVGSIKIEKQNGNKSGDALRYNKDKLEWGLVDFKALEPLVEVLMFGAQKYAPHNWKKGLDKTQILESLLRHTFALLKDESHDKESGLHHIGHILCNAMFYSFFINKK